MAGYKAKLLCVLDVVLRVPPVFGMDAILNAGSQRVAGEVIEHIDSNDDMIFLWSDWNTHSLAFFFVRVIGFVAAFIVFLLPWPHLLLVYRWLTSVASILGSYWVHAVFVRHQTQIQGARDRLHNFALHFTIQCVFATAFCFTYIGPRGPYARRLAVLAIVSPAVSGMIQDTYHVARYVPLASTLVCLLYVMLGVLTYAKVIYYFARLAVGAGRYVMQHYGVHVLLENEWIRLHVPHVLRVFWLTRCTEQVVFWMGSRAAGYTGGLQEALEMTGEEALVATKSLLVQGSDTIVAVFGMTSVVASGAHHLGVAVQRFLMTEDEEEHSFGTVSAILFLILALQTGLTSLPREKRFIRLYRNFCLLFTAILHFVHNIVDPLLMSLGASRNRSLQRHGRALAAATFLLAFPSWFLVYLWSSHQVNTWLLAVSAFCVEVVVKVVISLLIYGLFLLDARRNAFWEQLDDYIYYIKATGKSIEFVFGIFLFFNGAWILLFESGGTIRAFMMGIHAYFNIWSQAKAGWEAFIRRREAVNKINAFPEATEAQLRKFDDVCAICYQEMTTARMTNCRHLFHTLCLRKWLYIQDRCPLCHKALYPFDNEEQTPTLNANETQNIPQTPVLLAEPQRPHEHQD